MGPLRCKHCEDVIGVYEPMIVVRDGQPRETSRAADGEAGAEVGLCYHPTCFTRAESSPVPVTLVPRRAGDGA